MFRLLTCLFALFSSAFLSLAQDTLSASHDFLPKNSVWVNSDFPVAIETFTQKVLLVVITDENCVECNYFLSELQNDLFFNHAVQLVQVMKGNPENPVSRKHLLQYIQRYGYKHPIGVVPDFAGFKSATVTQTPYFLMYEKNMTPLTMGQGYQGFMQVRNRLQELAKEKLFLESCIAYQMKPSLDPIWWADPVVETPTYIANQENGTGLFINDAAHNRILGFDENGNMVLPVCSPVPGFLDDNIYNSQFRCPNGMFHHDDKLYVADTYNNRVRVVDMRAQKVSTILGNGYITFSKAQTIDGKFQPLGLPMDVVVDKGKLYVISAATNQLFEVDLSDGMAKSLCDFPQSAESLLRSSPVNLSLYQDDFLVTMSDGQLYNVDKKGKMESLTKKETFRFNAACEWLNGIAGVTKDGKIVYYEKGKWTMLGDSDPNKKMKNAMMVSNASDIIVRDDELYISDTDNHFVRIVNAPTDKLMKNFWIKLSPDLIGFDPAYASGEVIQMDSVLIAKDPVKVNVLLDLHGYKIVPNGRNEAIINDITEKVSISQEVLTKEEFSFNIKTGFENPDIYVEFYLTLEHPETPGLYIIKRAYLDFPVVQDENASKTQEQVYSLNLLPY